MSPPDTNDIARSQMDFRFRGNNGHAADITGMTDFIMAAKINGIFERAEKG